MKRTLLLSLTAASALLLAAPYVADRAGEVVLAVLAAVFPVLLMALGAAGKRGLGPLRWLLPVVALVVGGSLLAMLALAGESDATDGWLGLPASAVVQLLGLFGLPAVLVVLAYALTFDRHGPRAEDLERLRALRRHADRPEAD